MSSRFERLILRPLWVLIILAAVAFGIKSLWWWVGGCALAAFYLGTIGSKLHPDRSASQLAQGAQPDTLAAENQSVLVGQACTRVGMLVGAAAVAVFWGLLELQWYWAILIGWFVLFGAGTALKLAFAPPKG